MLNLSISFQGMKVDGTWTEIGESCVTTDVAVTDTAGFKMLNLRGDTQYRIEVKAHNAIGYSKPATFLMRTAVGESTNVLGSLLYYGGSSANHNLANRNDLLLFMLFSFCVRFFVRQI